MAEAVTAHIAVILKGGLIDSIISNRAFPGLEIVVIDYDIEGAHEEALMDVRQGRGDAFSLAAVSRYDVEATQFDFASDICEPDETPAAAPAPTLHDKIMELHAAAADPPAREVIDTGGEFYKCVMQGYTVEPDDTGAGLWQAVDPDGEPFAWKFQTEQAAWEGCDRHRLFGDAQ